jgi:CheY-like chemotaxis protein
MEAVLGNEDWGQSDATMRVLVVDQEPEMLEAIARTFAVDVATSKATCIDLLRANEFDVLVACERLDDGSGLELLSHVGQRWPHVLRVLAIEPARRQLLRGRLGVFRLFETIPYPIDEARLEAALNRAADALAATDPGEANSQPFDEPEPTPARTYRSNTVKPNPAAQPTASKGPLEGARRSGGRTAQTPPSQQARNEARSSEYPPLPAKGSKIVPLGSPEVPGYKILPHDYNAQSRPSTLLHRHNEDAEKQPTLQEKAAALAAGAVAAVVRYIKPQSSSPPRTPPTAPSRRKR